MDNKINDKEIIWSSIICNGYSDRSSIIDETLGPLKLHTW